MWTLNIYQRPKISGAQVATDVNVKASDIDDQEHSIGVEVVVHERKGAYGGSGLVKKPSNAKNGASNLPLILKWTVFPHFKFTNREMFYYKTGEILESSNKHQD
ncbi:hypothetical protein ACS0TY_033429 [Phlomoides rotata]